MAVVITIATDEGGDYTVDIAGCAGGDKSFVVPAADMPQQIKDLETNTTNSVLVLGLAHSYLYMTQLGDHMPSGALGVSFREGAVLYKKAGGDGWLPIA